MRWVVVAVLAATAPFVVGCDEAEEAAQKVGARAAAEGFRVSIKAQDTTDDSGGVRNLEALQEAADDLPGDPEVIGIRDGDGDGLDDDGFVELKVEDEYACVTLPESGDEVDVTGGRCS